MFRILLLAMLAIYGAECGEYTYGGVPGSYYPPSPAVLVYPLAPGRALQASKGANNPPPPQPPTKTGQPSPQPPTKTGQPSPQPPTKTGQPSPVGSHHVIRGAVHSRRWVEYVPYVSTFEEPAGPQLIEVEGNTTPVRFLFRTNSAPILLQQAYIAAPPQSLQHTRSEEQVQHLSHEVHKTLVQDVREVIKPVRRITTFIEPVQEEVRTIVAKSDGKRSEKPVTQQEEEQETEQQQQEQQQEVKSPTLLAAAPAEVFSTTTIVPK